MRQIAVVVLAVVTGACASRSTQIYTPAEIDAMSLDDANEAQRVVNTAIDETYDTSGMDELERQADLLIERKMALFDADGRQVVTIEALPEATVTQPVVIQASGDRWLTWEYSTADFESGCPFIDPTDESLGRDTTSDPGCLVGRFEVWGEPDPTDPSQDNQWLDAGLTPSPEGVADRYGYMLPTGLTYRFVRACNTTFGCSTWAEILRPGAPTQPRFYTEP